MLWGVFWFKQLSAGGYMAHTLQSTIAAICESGKGILAGDESTSTIAKRLADIQVESTEASRRAYRELLFTTPEIERFISGVIMYEETLFQASSTGVDFVDLLADRGILSGIKVDCGLVDLALSQGEKVTQGIDTLSDRLAKFRERGASFAKWRAVYSISDVLPSRQAIVTNAQLLARYAALCQTHEIVPIVEPEVLMDGDHTLERCREVTQAVLHEVFAALALQNVALEHIILKPSMVISGSTCSEQASVEQVAEASLSVYRECVPASVPTINFLSGGQSCELATAHLQAMNELSDSPWILSYS